MYVPHPCPCTRLSFCFLVPGRVSFFCIYFVNRRGDSVESRSLASRWCCMTKLVLLGTRWDFFSLFFFVCAPKLPKQQVHRLFLACQISGILPSYVPETLMHMTRYENLTYGCSCTLHVLLVEYRVRSKGFSMRLSILLLFVIEARDFFISFCLCCLSFSATSSETPLLY